MSQTNLYILASLVDGPKHGYAILKDIEVRGRGAVRPKVGNLYVALRRLAKDGLIEPAGIGKSEERRKVYRVSDLGESVLRANVARTQWALEEKWAPAELEDRMLTVLVTDIRNSSMFLSEASPLIVSRFLQRFVSITQEVLGSLVPAGEYRFDRFVGDGALIFFSEPNPSALLKVGPGRAATAALLMVREFRKLRRAHAHLTEPLGAGSLGLAAGISYGSVLYGSIGEHILPGSTGIGETVVTAFRLAEVAEQEQVLVSADARSHIAHAFKTRRLVDIHLRGLGHYPVWQLLESSRAGTTARPSGAGL